MRPLSLPAQLTSFIGRERELAEATRLLSGTRLLTLTGPGGSGKTRLALRLAGVVAATFPDGVYFVPLAPIIDRALLLPSIAQSIGLHDAREGSLIDVLVNHLRDMRLLLVLDNFEQLLPAATLVEDLLRQTQHLKALVTSRASLRISGEQEFLVPPLGLPDANERASAATVGSAESVRLFVERARAALPDFEVRDGNALHLARIAERLDGLPLALELAAARVKVLPPDVMLPRLDHSLRVLVAGARDLPDRQQTLRATIAWSYGLLSPGAQRLLAACAVFHGGATLERIESVCGVLDLGRDTSVLDALEELVDHNLMRRIEARRIPRLTMLETIREFAAERLADMPEESVIRQQHASEFGALMREGGRRLSGPDEPTWLELLEAEHHNLRAALDWYAAHSADEALQLAISMRPFWSAHGHFSEGRQRLLRTLEKHGQLSPTRVRGLNCAAWLAVDQGDYTQAAVLLDESVTLARALGDELGEASSLLHRGRCYIASGHPEDGVPYLDAALPTLRARAEPVEVAIGLLYWGLVAIFTEQPAVACDRLAEGVDMCHQLGFKSLGARAQYLLSVAHMELGDLAVARNGLADALRTSVELDDYWVIAQQIGALAGLAAKTGRPWQALRLAGFQAAYSRAHEFSVPIVMLRRLEAWLEPSRRALASTAAQAFAEGEQLSIEEAVAEALSPTSDKPTGGGLTPRELEVASLVADGASNRAIAAALSLSVRTVEVHVDHILTKLDLGSRTQLAAWFHRTHSQPGNT